MSRARLLGFILVVSVGLVFVSGAEGAAITADITATGSITYDTVNSTSTGTATHSGSITSSVGEGATVTMTTFTDGIPTGTNPLAPVFTHTGDGVSYSATGGGSGVFGETLAGIDVVLNLTNNSLTQTYVVRFMFTWTNSGDADGTDAYGVSELLVDQPPLNEIRYSQALSDVLFGDELNGNLTGGFGAPVSDSGARFRSVLLAPGATDSLEAQFDLEGGTYDAISSFSTSGVGSFTIFSVTAVPEPGSFALMAAGLLGLAGAWRRKRKK